MINSATKPHREVTFFEIKMILEMYSTFNKMSRENALNIPGNISYAVHKNEQYAQKCWQEYLKQHYLIAEQYVETDKRNALEFVRVEGENGQSSVEYKFKTPESKVLFEQKIEELMKSKITLELFAIPISDGSGLSVHHDTMLRLWEIGDWINGLILSYQQQDAQN